jgi:hypothetical protein
MLGVADDPIEAFLFPQFAGPADRGIDMLCRDPLHGPDEIFQFISVKRTKNEMAMVGHDDPGVELIPLAVEVVQSVSQVVGPALFTKVTRSVTFVRPSLRPANDLSSVFFPVLFRTGFRMRGLPVRSEVLDLNLSCFGSESARRKVTK